jgi:hypothetical protein
MVVKYLINSDRMLKILSLIFLFVFACSTIEPDNITNSCLLFKEKKNWYKATKKSFDKWNAPISLQLAIINQESSFNQFAKPKRKRVFAFIPGKRPSTAFGFAQVTNPTWNWYKLRTGNTNASRANFNDVTDFIGWYSEQTYKMLGISKNDAYNQYLAYHEGHNGWKNKSYSSKEWLIDVAKRVELNSNKYNKQLEQCEKELNRKKFLGII